MAETIGLILVVREAFKAKALKLEPLHVIDGGGPTTVARAEDTYLYQLADIHHTKWWAIVLIAAGIITGMLANFLGLLQTGI